MASGSMDMADLAPISRRDRRGTRSPGLGPDARFLRDVLMPTVNAQLGGPAKTGGLTGPMAWVWKGSGVALGVSMPGRDEDGNRAERARDLSFRLARDQIVRTGDLVSVYPGDEPERGDQHLRVVQSVERVSDERGRRLFEVRLGPALPYAAMPTFFRSRNHCSPISYESRGPEVVALDEDGKTLAAFPAGSPADREGLERALGRLIVNGGRLGLRNGQLDRQAGYKVEAGMDGEQRRWNLLDPNGHVAQTFKRGMFDRRPPQQAEAMLAVAMAAYQAGAEFGRRLRMDPALAQPAVFTGPHPGPGADLVTGPEGTMERHHDGEIEIGEGMVRGPTRSGMPRHDAGIDIAEDGAAIPGLR